jgi:ssDNA-binding Zn-finger/Zn-ribbon topoisomerase 1
VSFGPGALRGDSPSSPGEVDYRLARQSVLSEFRKGRLAQHEICDAHPELQRAARECSETTKERCPVCEDADLVLVTYVFGPKLPSHGRCITSRAELRAMAKRRGDFACYIVEVCPDCSWNHLARTFVLNPARSA